LDDFAEDEVIEERIAEAVWMAQYRTHGVFVARD